MSEMIMERITENLNRLKLSKIQEVLPMLTEDNKIRELSHLAFLDRLLEEEVTAKEERRIRTTLKIAGLPFEKTIEEYDFTFNPSLDKRLLMSLFDLDFLVRNENVIFLGPPGVGKTHLATALAIKACYFGVSIYFTTLAELICKLKRDAELSRKGKGRSYYKSGLVKKPISFSNLFLTAMNGPVLLSPPTKVSLNGKNCLAIRWWSRPFLTDCFIIVGSSISRGTAIG
jgi:hypothetical protein